VNGTQASITPRAFESTTRVTLDFDSPKDFGKCQHHMPKSAEGPFKIRLSLLDAEVHTWFIGVEVRRTAIVAMPFYNNHKSRKFPRNLFESRGDAAKDITFRRAEDSDAEGEIDVRGCLSDTLSYPARRQLQLLPGRNRPLTGQFPSPCRSQSLLTPQQQRLPNRTISPVLSSMPNLIWHKPSSCNRPAIK
jgi:hypothetical protein